MSITTHEIFILSSFEKYADKLDARFYSLLRKAITKGQLTKEFEFKARVKSPVQTKIDMRQIGLRPPVDGSKEFNLKATSAQVLQLLKMDNVIYLQFKKPFTAPKAQ